jgi:hypothetical protein
MKKSLIIEVCNGGVIVDITVCCMVLGIMLGDCNNFDSIVVVVVVIDRSRSEKRIELVVFIVLVTFVFL